MDQLDARRSVILEHLLRIVAVDGLTPVVASALLILFAFGVGKAALMPFHFWLPNAMVAPTPVSALLHAVAVVKAGVFTILKVAVYVFGEEILNATASREFILAVACITINVYFPEAAVEELSAQIEDEIQRRAAEAAGQSTTDEPVDDSANSDDQVDVPGPQNRCPLFFALVSR